MARFGRFLKTGIGAIALAVAVGFLGLWIKGFGGVWSVLGWIVAVVGFGMAWLSLWQVVRVTRLQRRGMKMAREDPERFERLRQEYREAERSLEEDEPREGGGA